MCFKELKFNDQSLKATMRLNAVWFDYQDISRILKSLYSDSAIQQVIAPMSYQAEDESFKVKTTDGEATVINDSAVFRWIERLNDGDDFNEALDTFRRFISHSAIPTMYRDYYAEPEEETDQNAPKQTTVTYNGVNIKTVCDLQDGIFWLAVADFKKAVEYTAPSTQIVQYTTPENTKLIETKTKGGQQKIHFINYQGLYEISERCYKQSIKDFVAFLANWIIGYTKGAEDWKGVAVAKQPDEEDESDMLHSQEYDATDEIESLKSEIAGMKELLEATSDIAQMAILSTESFLKFNHLPLECLLDDDETTIATLSARYNIPLKQFIENYLEEDEISVIDTYSALFKNYTTSYSDYFVRPDTSGPNVIVDPMKTVISVCGIIVIYKFMAKQGIYPKY